MAHTISTIEEEQLITLLKKLIRIPSAIQDGCTIYDYVRTYLEGQDLTVETNTVDNPYLTYSEVTNLYLRTGNKKGPKIMVNAHLDTVPTMEGNWFHPPYSANEVDGRIYGVGAADMKGGCAAAIISVLALLERKEEINGEIFLSLVFGEEAPFSLGTDTLLREYDLSEYDLVIVTEPSPQLAINDFCYSHREYHDARFPTPIIGAEGRVLFEVEFRGESAHASHPSEGINALHDAAHFISKIADFDIFTSIKMGRGHYVVININGGDRTFTVPGYCKILVNRQLVVGEDEYTTLDELNRLVSKLKLDSKVTIKQELTPTPELLYRPYLCEKSEFIDKFMERMPQKQDGTQCKFTSSSVGDFNLFGTRAKVPTLVFGPGGGNLHAPNEYVKRQEVIDTANYLLDFFMGVF